VDPKEGGSSFTDRLEYLFGIAGYRDQYGVWNTFTTADAAEKIAQLPERYRVKVSRSYLGMLRTGRYANPSIAVVLALVRFFNDHLPEGHRDISVDWLASGAADPVLRPTDSEHELFPELDDTQVRHIAMRAGEMTPALRAQLIAILDMMDQQK
jgi:hypothetical protein